VSRSASACDVAVVGGGIVGLAVAHELLARHPRLRVVVLDKESRVAAHQSGHNSGVIHSGLYYAPGSAKARTAVAGAERMKRFCGEHGVRVEVCGKVVVATDERELPALAELHRRGTANGVPGLVEIGPERLREIEPHAAGLRALHVPGAAVVDYREVAAKLAERIVAAGGEVRLGAEVVALRHLSREIVLRTSGGELTARSLVGCAGLQSDRLVALEGGRPPARIVPFRGEYYELVAERHGLVRGLIYPVPDPRFPFLGVHFTRLVGGGVEAGPNAVLATAREGYRRRDVAARDVAEMLTFPGFWRMARRHWRMGLAEQWRSLSKRAFVAALRRLVPAVEERDLVRAGSGVRAQALLPSGGFVDDFLIVERPRALHVCNAPSPAATASLEIAGEVARRAEASFELFR
jgi:L-2-hydroxyglutarate oxidase